MPPNEHPQLRVVSCSGSWGSYSCPARGPKPKALAPNWRRPMAVTFGAPRGGLEKSGIGLIPRVSAGADGYGIMQGPAKRPEWKPHAG